MTRRVLLVCGVLSSVLYVGIDQLAALIHPAYHSFTSQTISELGARGAPTRALVTPLFVLYEVLALAFVAGVWAAGRGNRALRITAAFLAARWLAGVVSSWFPMNVRGSGDLAGDAPHIVAFGVIVLFIFGTMISGAFALGRDFRRYSWASVAAFFVLGAVLGVQSAKVPTGEPTPWIGVTERVEVGVYLLWIAVLAIALLGREKSPATSSVPSGERVPVAS